MPLRPLPAAPRERAMADFRELGDFDAPMSPSAVEFSVGSPKAPRRRSAPAPADVAGAAAALWACGMRAPCPPAALPPPGPPPASRPRSQSYSVICSSAPIGFFQGHHPELVREPQHKNGGAQDVCVRCNATGDMHQKGYICGDGCNAVYRVLKPTADVGFVERELMVTKNAQDRIGVCYVDIEVTRTLVGSGAEVGGMRQGQRIIRIDGQPVHSGPDVQEAFSRAGKTVRVTVVEVHERRGGRLGSVPPLGFPTESETRPAGPSHTALPPVRPPPAAAARRRGSAPVARCAGSGARAAKAAATAPPPAQPHAAFDARARRLTAAAAP